MYLAFLSLPEIPEIAYSGVGHTLIGICAIPISYHGTYFRDAYAIAYGNYNSVDVTSSIKRVNFLLFY